MFSRFCNLLSDITSDCLNIAVALFTLATLITLDTLITLVMVILVNPIAPIAPVSLFIVSGTLGLAKQGVTHAKYNLV